MHQTGRSESARENRLWSTNIGGQSTWKPTPKLAKTKGTFSKIFIDFHRFFQTLGDQTWNSTENLDALGCSRLIFCDRWGTGSYPAEFSRGFTWHLTGLLQPSIGKPRPLLGGKWMIFFTSSFTQLTPFATGVLGASLFKIGNYKSSFCCSESPFRWPVTPCKTLEWTWPVTETTCAVRDGHQSLKRWFILPLCLESSWWDGTSEIPEVGSKPHSMIFPMVKSCQIPWLVSPNISPIELDHGTSEAGSFGCSISACSSGEGGARAELRSTVERAPNHLVGL